jgi:hypothetical protein
MFCLILLIFLLSRLGRRCWCGYGYYPGYYGAYPYPYGYYTPYDPYWRTRYYWDGYGYRRCH